MTIWHVWGDYVHTVPNAIGSATRDTTNDKSARATAKACGFDFETRMRNGFEPWAATFTGNGDPAAQEFAFSASGTVRGFKRL